MKKHLLVSTAAMALLAGAAHAQPFYTDNYTTYDATPTTNYVVPVAATQIVAPSGAAIITNQGTTMVPAGGTAVITTPSAAFYTPAGLPGNPPLTLGQLIALRITDPSLNNFKTALQQAVIPENFDISKGFTVFAPKNYDGSVPIDHYIVNDRVALNMLNGGVARVGHDHVTNLRGENLRISRINDSYFVNNQRVNNADRSPEGVIYTIGGNSDAAQLMNRI